MAGFNSAPILVWFPTYNSSVSFTMISVGISDLNTLTRTFVVHGAYLLFPAKLIVIFAEPTETVSRLPFSSTLTMLSFSLSKVKLPASGWFNTALICP